MSNQDKVIEVGTVEATQMVSEKKGFMSKTWGFAKRHWKGVAIGALAFAAGYLSGKPKGAVDGIEAEDYVVEDTVEAPED